ncbi:IS701 family transposase [Arsenophonus sp. PmNCSU2021_1]|uniref:IS701 family transposase n=1 Tax=Arsenophonus sp. PmNCSU2021_1 TaxID=3118989 RepID=UPI002FF184BC
MSGYPCIKDIYKTFLQVSSLRYSGLALSEVSPSPLSHDTVSQWLKSRCFRPKDLWRLVEPSIDKKSPCVLIADDTLIAKTRSKKIEMVHYQYSGNEHEVIAGIGLVNLLWHDLTKVESIPINYRIYDKDSDGKIKNTHFSEMLTLAKKRGIMPEAVVMDAWYSSLDNLKSIRSHGWMWVNTLRKNRIVNHNKQLNKLDISEEGTSIHLRGYGWVTVFKFTAKNGRIDYIVTNKENPTRQYVKSIMDARWSVEVYHREVKQNCGIERCQARTSRAQRNHIFLAISAWFEQHKRRISEKITLYQQNWDVIKSAITEQIRVLLAYPN